MYFTIFVFIVFGLYQIFLGTTSSFSTKLTGTKMIGKIRKQSESKDIWKQKPFVDVIRYLSKHVFIQPSRKLTLENQLTRTGMDYTPAEYVARSYCAGGIGLILTLISLLLHSAALSILCLLFAGFLYLKNRDEVSDKVKKINDTIRAELPQFTKMIEASIYSEKDIVRIIQRYTKIAGPEFRRELEILLLEMNTGSVPVALQNFDARLNMIEVSRLSRALINIERGIDQGATLTFLANDMNLLEREHSKVILAKRPGKMKRAILPAAIVMVIAMFYVFVESSIHIVGQI